MSTIKIPIARFRLGRIVTTPSALEVLANEAILLAIARHQAGDWGEAKHPELNERALLEGTRVLSVYRSLNGVIFWIITEADRSTTTVMLPGDY